MSRLPAGHPIRGGIYWARPEFPDGSTNDSHRCICLRTPQPGDTNIPILTMHSLNKRLRKVNDCCMVFEAKSYRTITRQTVVDATMPMFLHESMLERHVDTLSNDDMMELEDCIGEALQLPPW